MKRITAILIIATLMLALPACTKKAEPEPEPVLPKVVFVAEGGLTDNIANTIAFEGMTKAKEEFEIETELLETETSSDSIGGLSQAAAAGAKLVITTGFVSVETMTEIAAQYPETLFALLNYDEEIAANVMGLAYKEQEGAFIAGVIAALSTQTQVIGFVGGEDSELLESYEYGFRSGVKAINPNAQVAVAFAETFEDPNAGRTVAQTLISNGADILYQEAGKSGSGAIEAAEQAGIQVIAGDCGQAECDSEAILCSTFKRLDSGVYLAIQMMMEGDFEGGVFELGLDFEAVGYTDEEERLLPETASQAKAYIKAISAGDIYVPSNRSEFEEFVVPEGGFLVKQ
ncbi:MAG: BMP family ABC transporter substrate-binding protein [Eubacteriales bacterium]|nr:BMP family ABC transporter substrate-binding protein [Eubacteriales bacterium]